MIQDVFAAFDWVVDNIGKYRGDLNNVFLAGDSAGGNLAALSISILADPALKEKYGVDSKIKFNAAGFICGAFNIEKYAKHRIPAVNYFKKQFFGPDYKNSPFQESLTIRNNKLEAFPPVFLISSGRDFIRNESKEFAEELKKRGVPYEFKFIENKDSKHKLIHVYNILWPEYEESQEATGAMLNFFRKYLV